MRHLSFTKQLLIGLLLGLIITPAQPAKAQWITHDPIAYALKIQEFAKEIDFWLQTVEHYSQMYDKAVKQVTSLGGILANIERLANMDNEFERLRYELQNAYGRLAEAQAVLKQYEDMLTTEMAKPEDERHSLGIIQTQISNTKIQIEQIKTQINDLTEKLAAKTQQYGIQLETRADYGQQVHQTNKAWEATVPVRKDILDEIDKTFEKDEGIDDDPADGNN